MAKIQMTITMPRGDIHPVNFVVNNIGEPNQEIQLTEIYFTVKASFDEIRMLFQKRLSTGEIQLMDNGSYQFVIMPEDTDRLKIGKYVFDIEVIGNNIKQTFIGEFVITEEVTYACNEQQNT